MRTVRRLVVGLILLAVVVGAAGIVTVNLLPDFGGRASGARLALIEASPQFKNARFENVVPPAPRTAELMWDYTKRQFGGTQVRTPPRPIPVVRMSADGMDAPPKAGLRAIWFGHASVYLELDGLRLFVDPVLSEYASPIAGIGPKRFHPPPLALEQLPRMDAVLISHDHYDHLDMRTVKQLAAKGSRFVVPLGIGAHLARWGVPETQVRELDWWQSEQVGDVTLTSTPVRHYSGRGLRDANATLWSSWVLAGPHNRVYFSGDTGAGDHFKSIGDRFGPFDLTLIKIGAYGPGQPWIDIHMSAEDAIAAHVALRGKRLLPVHWGTFNLAFHAWNEPIERAVAAAARENVEIVTPRVGDVVTAGQPFASQPWWRP